MTKHETNLRPLIQSVSTWEWYCEGCEATGTAPNAKAMTMAMEKHEREATQR